MARVQQQLDKEAQVYGIAVIDVRRHNSAFCSEHFLRLCRETRARGNAIPDAYHAALAIESDCDSFGVRIHFNDGVKAWAALVDLVDAIGIFFDEFARAVFAGLQALLEIGDG